MNREEKKKDDERYMSYRNECAKRFKFNHVFDIGFSVSSNHEKGEDITAENFLEAIINRAHQAYRDGELLESVGYCNDTYEW